MPITQTLRLQCFFWLVYWLFLALINLFYFTDKNFGKPVLLLWTLLFTLCGVALHVVQTRVYRFLHRKGTGRTPFLLLLVGMALVSAYLWGIFEPLLSWMINPEIKELVIHWSINSRGTISLMFVQAFFGLLFCYTAFQNGPAAGEGEPLKPSGDGREKEPVFSLMWGNSVVLLPMSEIKTISIKGNYATITDRQNRQMESRKTLSAWETELDPEAFLRIHRSTIINRQFIERIETRHNYTLTIKMVGLDTVQTVSRRYSSMLKRLWNL